MIDVYKCHIKYWYAKDGLKTRDAHVTKNLTPPESGLLCIFFARIFCRPKIIYSNHFRNVYTHKHASTFACMHAYTRIHTHARTHTYIHTHARTHARTHTCTHTQTHTHNDIDINMDATIYCIFKEK